MTLALRVAARFQRQAEQAAGKRQHVRNLTQPINKPHGIDRTIVRENGEVAAVGDDVVTPHQRDIRPKDVFSPTPNTTGVLNLAQTGKDLTDAVGRQIRKDKGYTTVNNLSQYLIWTHGGSGGGPQGKKS